MQEAVKSFFNNRPPWLATTAVIVFIGYWVIIGVFEVFDKVMDYMNKNVSKDVTINIIYKNQPLKLSSKYQLKLNDSECEIKDDINGVFVCNVKPSQKYKCVLKYNGNQTILIKDIEQFDPLTISKMPLSIDDDDYKIDEQHNFSGSFKLIDISNGKIVCPEPGLKLKLCGTVPIKLNNKYGVISFHVPWKELNHYYYEACKESFDVSIDQSGFIFGDSIEKKFFFFGDTTYFDIEQPRFIKMNNVQIEFNGQTNKNNVTFLKDSEENFLFKFKAKDFTPKTAINMQIDGHTITIEGNSIKFDNLTNMLEQNITSQPILEVEMRRDKKNIWVDIFQNGKKISIIDNIMILADHKIGKLKIGHYYTGELSNKTILSIYDVSIQKWVPVNSADTNKP
ncbi:MAG: hypothetical protein Q7T77_11585 [Sulfuricurvum sp.]|nr:hypothetical protein [Sulfuricurvum sp.]